MTEEADILRHNTINGTALLALNRNAIEGMGIIDDNAQTRLLQEVHNLKERVRLPLTSSNITYIYFLFTHRCRTGGDCLSNIK